MRIKHIVFEPMQIEPSSQFGLRMTPEAAWPRWYEAGGEPTHHILHYTFGHEYSREGVPMVDTRFGEWRFDKRPYQQGLHRGLLPPPRCAAEAAWTLWTKLNQTMAAAGPGGWEEAPQARPAAPLVGRLTAGLRSSGAAARLVGTGPWQWQGAGELFLLRGGWAMTPWGTARWGAADASDRDLPPGAELVLFLCGVERWTHSISLDEGNGTATLRFEGRPPPPAAGDPAGASGGGGSAGEPSLASLPGGLAAAGVAAADVRAALAADDDPRADADADAQSVRRRLLGTGPWEGGPFSSIGHLYFLRGGVAYDALSRQAGNWSVAGAEGEVSQLSVRMGGGGATHALEVSCWRIRRKGGGGGATDFTWRAPARRCFSSCSDRTTPAAEAAVRASPLGRVAMAAAWSWGYNTEGVRFAVEKGEAVFISPWGHGRWGFVDSRDDVIFVDFVQEIHMLREEAQPARGMGGRSRETVDGGRYRASSRVPAPGARRDEVARMGSLRTRSGRGPKPGGACLARQGEAPPMRWGVPPHTLNSAVDPPTAPPTAWPTDEGEQPPLCPAEPPQTPAPNPNCLAAGFDRKEARFVSTRCKDGDTVGGRPLRAEPGGGALPAGWYKW